MWKRIEERLPWESDDGGKVSGLVIADGGDVYVPYLSV